VCRTRPLVPVGKVEPMPAQSSAFVYNNAEHAPTRAAAVDVDSALKSFEYYNEQRARRLKHEAQVRTRSVCTGGNVCCADIHIG